MINFNAILFIQFIPDKFHLSIESMSLNVFGHQHTIVLKLTFKKFDQDFQAPNNDD